MRGFKSDTPRYASADCCSSLKQKLGHTTRATQHLATINQRVSPMDKLGVKPVRLLESR